jgi:hypothetical protein
MTQQSALTAVNPEQLNDAPMLDPVDPPDPQRIDWNRPYTMEGGRRRNPSYLVQDGLRFDPQTGKLKGG